MRHLDGLRILVVDDEPFMLITIKAALRSVGRFEITGAGDGERALSEVCKTKPAVVLCDVSMAPVSGLQFLERLRNHADHGLRDTPVVLVTMDQELTTIQNAGRLKVQGYLVKPVSPQQIKDRLLAIFPAA
jgi:two-component system chemotaxis response regulator CheY